MKIRHKITLATLAVIVFTSIFSGLVLFWLINDGFTQFLNAQLALIENQQMGPRIRQVLEQLKDYRELVRSFNRTILLNIIFSSLVGILIGLFISFLLSTRIVNPINKLIHKVKKIRGHDYSDEIKIEGDDEMAQLGNEFEQLRKELLRVDTLRKDLVSDLAHELNTPLTTIKGIVEGIEEDVYKPDKKNLNIIKEEVSNLSSLIESMRHFNEIRTRDYHSKVETIRVNDEIKKLVGKFKKDLKDKHIDLVIDLDKTIKDIKINRLAFLEVISNLLSNAIKYSDQKSSIWIETTVNKKSIIVTIKDEGHGISEENQKLIFERFFRVDKSRSKKTGGIGLGLAIVKELVTECGWEIDLKSSLGDGSEFKLIIPQ